VINDIGRNDTSDRTGINQRVGFVEPDVFRIQLAAAGECFIDGIRQLDFGSDFPHARIDLPRDGCQHVRH